MPNTVKYLTNKTQDQEHSLPCIKCTGKTAHKVLASVDERGKDDDNPFWWTRDNQIVQCLGCKTVSFRSASTCSEDYLTDDGGNEEYNVVESLYPPRVEGIRGFGDDAYYLPAKVRRIYDETLIALSNQAPVLAGIGLRALLETVCKEKKAGGRKLLEKIDSLVSARLLTPANAEVLHKIRTLGNAAAHEVKPHSEGQLGLAMDIVQHLLKDVYILPEQVESAFKE